MSLVAALTLAAVTSAPHPREGLYFASDFDVGARFGSYRWTQPATADAPAVTVAGSTFFVGADLGAALGWTIASRTAVALEGAIGYGAGSSTGIPHTGIDQVFLARIGLRIERDFGGAFIRGSFGWQTESYGEGNDELGAANNVVDPEAASGPYGALTFGLRGRIAGVFLRFLAVDATSEHAHSPSATLSLGAELVSW